MKHYAIEHFAGLGTRWAGNLVRGSERPAVWVRAWDTRAERDAACIAYRAPQHSPSAALVSVPASHYVVRRTWAQARRNTGGGFISRTDCPLGGWELWGGVSD